MSAVSASLRRAVFVLMGVLALQVVLTGLAPPFEGASGDVLRIVAYGAPTRWASSGLGADLGLSKGTMHPTTAGTPVPPEAATGGMYNDLMWTHDRTHVLVAAAVLLRIAVTTVLAAIAILGRRLRSLR